VPDRRDRRRLPRARRALRGRLPPAVAALEQPAAHQGGLELELLALLLLVLPLPLPRLLLLLLLPPLPLGVVWRGCSRQAPSARTAASRPTPAPPAPCPARR
jgi:hypothetical protein